MAVYRITDEERTNINTVLLEFQVGLEQLDVNSPDLKTQVGQTAQFFLQAASRIRDILNALPEISA